MFPYHDENETQRTAVVTIAIIALNVFVWFFVQGAGTDPSLPKSVCELGLIPGELTQSLPTGAGFLLTEDMACVVDPGPAYAHVLTSMFLHGGWMHLLGNMWFLWLFGNNIEDSMTRPRFLLFYLLCGIGAALAQVVADPRSMIPMVGASGAISGVMGAYLILFPKVRVYTLVPLGFFITTFALPAWVMLLYWMGLQVLGGFSSIGADGGTAFWAHVGGFLMGILWVKVFSRTDHLAAHRHAHWRPAREGWN